MLFRSHYTGQTGRCLNVRLREHERKAELEADSQETNQNLPLQSAHSKKKGDEGLLLKQHIRICRCTAVYKNTEVRAHRRYEATREVFEAFYIGSERGTINQASVEITPREASLVEEWVAQQRGR